jgi:hypothetical protein
MSGFKGRTDFIHVRKISNEDGSLIEQAQDRMKL